MARSRVHAGALMALMALQAGGQQTKQAGTPTVNLNLIFLDPAHGGADPGAHLAEKNDEKDATLALEVKLRAALGARGFSVISSRDGDANLTSDQRAEMANHSRALACILLHATPTGSGPYLAVSTLAPDASNYGALPWGTAQAASVSDSLALQDKLVGGMTGVSFKPVVLRASVPPMDSLACPAVLVELAPLSGTPATDGDYQQRVATGIAQALVAWRAQAQPAPPLVLGAAAPAGAAAVKADSLKGSVAGANAGTAAAASSAAKTTSRPAPSGSSPGANRPEAQKTAPASSGATPPKEPR